jgi:alpha-1,2-mannosyltransferase
METAMKKLYNNKYSILTIGFLALSLLIFGYEIPYIFKSNVDMNHQDFQWFYYAFHVLWDKHSPHLLYDMTYEFDWIRQQGYIIFDGIANKYVYPPQFAVLLSWFSLLPIRQANIMWNILALLSYLAVIYMLIKISYKGSKWLPKLFLLAIGLSFKAFYWDLLAANSNWLILFCITLSFYLYDRNKIKSASIPLAVAITFKVMPILIIGYFLWRRKWNYVLYTVLSSMIITLITWLLVGYDVMRQYVASFFKLTSESMLNGGAPYNNSIKGVLMLTSLAKDNINFIFLAYVFFIALIIVLLPDLNHIVGNRFDFIIASTCTIWFSPMVENEHLLVTLIAFLILSGIVMEQYENGPSALPLDGGLKWGILSYWLSMALLSTYIGDRLDHYFPTHFFVALQLMTISILILAWKLKRHQTSSIHSLTGYRQLHKAQI